MKTKTLFACVLALTSLCVGTVVLNESFTHPEAELKATSLKTFTITNWQSILSEIKYKYEDYQMVDVNYYNENGDGSYLNIYTFGTTTLSATFGTDYIFDVTQKKSGSNSHYVIYIYLNNIVSVAWEYEYMATKTDFFIYTGNNESSGEHFVAETDDLTGEYVATTETNKLKIYSNLGYTSGVKTKLKSLSITYDASLCN